MKDGLFLFHFFSHKVGQSIYNLNTVNEISRFYSNSNDANTKLKKRRRKTIKETGVWLKENPVNCGQSK